MLSSDIGNFFGSMTTIYGHLWSHGADEIATWRKAMVANQVTANDLKLVSNRCLKDLPDRPPTMGQVIGMAGSGGSWPGPKLGQRQLASPKMTPQKSHGNRIMTVILTRAHGVQPDTLLAMRAATNAAVEDYERLDQDEGEFAAELDTTLRGVLNDHEKRTV